MDKNAIKKYAVWARRELIERVTVKAEQYEISTDTDPQADSVRDTVLTKDEKRQREKLIYEVQEKGFPQVLEEVAYTWFNRFTALRFMEVNGYLPTRVRVFTDADGAFKPQILTEAIHMELSGLDMEKVYALKEANDDDALFKYLIIMQCNALSEVLPGMFQRISDYTELLFPDNLLREGSVIEKMVTQGKSDSIPEEDWKDQIQIIGWLYQYYNTEPKDKVFADLKKNVKITKEKIPAATQLFTPDWIVRYMVENSLGRLWIEGHPNDELKANWKYYLDEAEQEPEVEAQLEEIRREYAALTPEQIKCIDPCSGSGHICAYLFDVLVQIYEAYGYTAREAVESIIKNNLYGLDIDERAAQLAYFSVMMKAVQYDSRFLRRKDENGEPNIPQPHVYSIKESNHLDKAMVEYFCNGDETLISAMNTLMDELHDAKEYGSILNVTQVDFAALYVRFDEIAESISLNREYILNELLPFVQCAEAMAQKYHAVVTNPLYMGGSGMSTKLSDYVKKNYPDSKSDLFAVFIEHGGDMTAKNGYQAMITQHVWMFIASYEHLRKKLCKSCGISSMIHLGANAFDEIAGEVVQTTAFVTTWQSQKNYVGKYYRILGGNTEKEKETLFLSNSLYYRTSMPTFMLFPRVTFVYWASEKLRYVFKTAPQLREWFTVRNGLTTGSNDTFLRLWYEVPINTRGIRWFPCNKGGAFRRWYGNRDYFIEWENDGYRLKHFYNKEGKLRSTLRNIDYNFRESVVVGHVASGDLAYRYVDKGFISESAVNSIYTLNGQIGLFYLLALLNSKVSNYITDMLNPTLGVSPEDILNIPVQICNTGKAEICAKENVSLSRTDWDSFETSWDFKRHPLIAVIPKNRMLFDDIDNIDLAECYMCWEQECEDRFNQLKANEEELNRIFIDIYGLQDELTPEVDDKDVTVRKADLQRDIKSLISYAVGCMFGRYSIYTDGLVYAGGKWDAEKYQNAVWIAEGKPDAIRFYSEHHFLPDKDNIIPICDDEYFHDDIANRFVDFIRIVYGANTLEENLKFIADALGGSGQPREVIRNYFLNDFYKDHCKIYQKRPIYWLFDSGKKNGFKCLIYMHRYQPDTIARIRTDYVHEQQARYRTAIAGLERQIADAPTSERVRLNKQLTKLKDQAEEARVYEEKIHHLADQMISIDLDDGVKVNYAKFADVLAKIK